MWPWEIKKGEGGKNENTKCYTTIRIWKENDIQTWKPFMNKSGGKKQNDRLLELIRQ